MTVGTLMVGRAPSVMSAICAPSRMFSTNAVAARRRSLMLFRIPRPVSTSSATWSGSLSGATLNTSRAWPSSRMMKSFSVRLGTGAPSLSATLA